MAAKAYLLLRTSPGLTASIHKELLNSRGVRSVEMITGPYDLIVAVEAASANEILRVIMNDIRPAAGIRDTLTCLVVPTEGADDKED